MAAKIKVGVVEDEMIIAQGILNVLDELGYDTTESAISYTEALGMIAEEKPDILLIDIILKGSKDGIDLAKKIKEEYNIPFIFLTANSDAATVERAKKLNPPAYLVKPFTKEALFTSIEICLNNFSASQAQPKEQENYVVRDYFFVKQGTAFIKVKIEDILYVESNDIYVYLHTATDKLMVRGSVQSYIDQLGAKRMLRIHKSYAVNIDHIDSVDAGNVIVRGAPLPLGRTYRDELISALGLK